MVSQCFPQIPVSIAPAPCPPRWSSPCRRQCAVLVGSCVRGRGSLSPLLRVLGFVMSSGLSSFWGTTHNLTVDFQEPRQACHLLATSVDFTEVWEARKVLVLFTLSVVNEFFPFWHDYFGTYSENFSFDKMVLLWKCSPGPGLTLDWITLKCKFSRNLAWGLMILCLSKEKEIKESKMDVHKCGCVCMCV